MGKTWYRGGSGGGTFRIPSKHEKKDIKNLTPIYHFTNKLPPRVCRMCSKKFSKEWSSGGVGAVCEICSNKIDSLDLVELGIIRNIKKIKDKHSGQGYSFTFEAKIDDDWYECYMPCGNWAHVKGCHDGPKHGIFSVPVGFWSLKDLYNKHKRRR